MQNYKPILAKVKLYVFAFAVKVKIKSLPVCDGFIILAMRSVAAITRVILSFLLQDEAKLD